MKKNPLLNAAATQNAQPPTFVSACGGVAAEVFDFPSIRVVVGLLSMDVFALPSLDNVLHVRCVNIDQLTWVEDNSGCGVGGSGRTSPSRTVAPYVHLHVLQKDSVIGHSTLRAAGEEAVISIPKPVDSSAAATMARFSALLEKRCATARSAIAAHLLEAQAVVEGHQQLMLADHQLHSSRNPHSTAAFTYPALAAGGSFNHMHQSFAESDNGAGAYANQIGSGGGDSSAGLGTLLTSQGRPSISLPVEESVGDFLWGGPESNFPSISVSRVNLSMEVSSGFDAATSAAAYHHPNTNQQQQYHMRGGHHFDGNSGRGIDLSSPQSASDQMMMSPAEMTTPQVTSIATPLSRDPSTNNVDDGDVAIVTIVSPTFEHQTTGPQSCVSSELELPNLRSTCAPVAGKAMVDYLKFRDEKDRTSIEEAVNRLRKKQHEEQAAVEQQHLVATPGNSPLVELVGNSFDRTPAAALTQVKRSTHDSRSSGEVEASAPAQQQTASSADGVALVATAPVAAIAGEPQQRSPRASSDHRADSYDAASYSDPPVHHQTTMTMSGTHEDESSAAIVRAAVAFVGNNPAPSAADEDPLLAFIDCEVSARTTFWHSRSGQGLLTLIAANTARIRSVELFHAAASGNSNGSSSASLSKLHEDLTTGEWVAERYEYDAECHTVRLYLNSNTSLNAFIHAMAHNYTISSVSFDSLPSVTDAFVLRLAEVEMEKAERSAIHTLCFRNCQQMTDNAAGAILNWLRFVREESTVSLKGVLRHVTLRGRVSPWSKTMYDAVLKEALLSTTLHAARRIVL